MKKAVIISIVAAASSASLALAQPGDSATKARCHGGGARAHRFEELDQNGDQVVTQDEMLKRITERFDAIDRNKDGKVTEEERAAAVTARREQHFAHKDKNGDGVLSSDELPPHWAKRLARFDENGDGKLSQMELKEVSEKHAHHGRMLRLQFLPKARSELAAHATERFQKLDENHDGKLTREELRSQRRAPVRGHAGRRGPNAQHYGE